MATWATKSYWKYNHVIVRARYEQYPMFGCDTQGYIADGGFAILAIADNKDDCPNCAALYGASHLSRLIEFE